MSERVGKGARQGQEPGYIKLDGEIMIVDLERHVLNSIRVQDLDKESLLKAHDRLWLMPPDRVRKGGYEAEILEINQRLCRFKLVETGEEFTVDKLTIVPAITEKHET